MRTAQFACGCWVHEVGVQRHPAIVGTMCCPIHLRPFPKLEIHFAMVTGSWLDELESDGYAWR